MVFTDAGIRKIPIPPNGAVQYFETVVGGGRALVLYVGSSGIKQWRCLYYDQGRPRSKKLGTYPLNPDEKLRGELTLKEARDIVRRWDTDKAIRESEAGTIKAVAEAWIEDHVDRERLRSADEIKRHLTAYVYPVIGKLNIYKIRRSVIHDLLRKIENRSIKATRRTGRRKSAKSKQADHQNGAKVKPKLASSQADAVLRTLNTMFNWYANEKDEDFLNPITSKMKRDKRSVAKKSRERILTDDEIRLVWKTCDKLDPSYRALVRMLLLTAQRREVVAAMKWSDISDGVWTIPETEREKTNIGRVRLPAAALTILEDVKKLDLSDKFIFPARGGNKTINAFSQRKQELNELLPQDMPHWVLHDLRRTARTLMTRISVPDRVAEVCLGHTIAGIEGVYNRFGYFEEKSNALQRLSDHIDLILNPPAGANVVNLKRRSR